LNERQSLYTSVADLTLTIDKLSVKQILELVSDYLKTI
jgi:hypothetical protein